MSIVKCGGPPEDLDIMAIQILTNDLLLGLDDHPLTEHEIADGETFLERVIDAVESALTKPGKVQRGFTERLGGHGAGIDAGATQMCRPFHKRDAFPEVCRLGGALFTGRARADDDEVIGEAGHNVLGALVTALLAHTSRGL
jgi:hypothetical protein